MFSRLISIWSLLISFTFLCYGHGLQGILLSVRGGLEHFPEFGIGFMTSLYFVGFALGAYFTPKFIHNSGHIRVFAAFASLASAMALVHLVYVDLGIWIIARFISGIAIASLYTVMESWLSGLGDRSNRGQLLSIYMIINLSFIALGQAGLGLTDPLGYTPFVIVSIALSLSLVPVCLSRARQPTVAAFDGFHLIEHARTSPLASVGCLLAGMTTATFGGLSGLFGVLEGIATTQISLFVAAFTIGGLLSQWPMGLLADLFSRRKTIALSAAATTISSFAFWAIDSTFTLTTFEFCMLAFALGFSVLPIYSLCVAHASDFAKPENLPSVCASLLLLFAAGSVLGPLGGALLMKLTGAPGLFLFMTATSGLLFLFTLSRVVVNRKPPHEAEYVVVPRTGIGVMAMDPRVMDESAPPESPAKTGGM